MDFLGLALLLLAGLLAGLVIVTAYTVRVLMYPPRRAYAFALSRGLPADPSELRFQDAAGAERLGAPFEQWTFRSRGFDLPVWDIKGCNPDGPTVILTHGWGDSRVVSLSRAPVLLRHASRLLLWDLPGHGEATGRSSLGEREPGDLVALVETARAAGAVVLYGHSLGAGVSIEAAARLGPERVAGIIAEAPYRRPLTPARNVLRAVKLPHRVSLPLALALLRPRFDRVRPAAALRIPLLLIHGDSDQICPLADAQEIAAAAPDARLVEIPGGGHVDLFADPRFAPHAADAIEEFLSSVLARAPAA